MADKFYTNEQGKAGEIYGNGAELAEAAASERQKASEALAEEAARNILKKPDVDPGELINEKDLGILNGESDE